MAARATHLLGALLAVWLAGCGADDGAAPGGSSSSSSSSSTGSSSSSSTSSSSSSSSSSSGGKVEWRADEDVGLCRLEGVREAEHGGFTGTGYLNGDNRAGAQLGWQITAPRALATELTIRYANGAGAARYGGLRLNGGETQVESLLFEAGASWQDWRELRLTVSLEAGANSLELVSEAAEGLPNIDALLFAEPTLAAGPCPAPSPGGRPYSIGGTTDMHDPSTILKDGDTYWTFGTGGGANNFPINALYSTDLRTWQRGPSPVPRNTYPSWINDKVPSFDGNFWAPDVIFMEGKYYLYYSAFSRIDNNMRSAIGVMVSDSLNDPNWRDLGPVVTTVDEPRSSRNEPVNVIDAGLYRDASGRVWMTYGSHYAGVFIREINPRTGLLLGTQRYNAAGNNGGWNEYEAAQVQYVNGFYYMFINLGDCCVGRDSDYQIFVGRSDSPTGPFITRDGRNLWEGDVLAQQAIDMGSSQGALLATQGNFIGPGHFGYLEHLGQHLVSIHHYDGTTADGWPGRLRLLEMTFEDGWPRLSYEFLLRE